VTLWIHGSASTYSGDRNLPPVEGWRLIREMGFEAVRLCVDSSILIEAPYRYNFPLRLDRDIEILTKLGFKILINPMWAPAHMSEGKPAYREYVYGCSIYDKGDSKGWRYADRCAWVEGTPPPTHPWDQIPGACGKEASDDRHRAVGATLPTSMDHHLFKPEKPYCLHPDIPHIDKAQMSAYGVALAERYGSIVSWWSIWNEPGGGWYWPPVSQPPWELAFERLVDEVWVPFVGGVRSVIPDAFFVGPDAESPGAMHFFSEAAAKVGLKVNALSGHLYAQGGLPFPDGVVTELDRPGGWLEVARQWSDGTLWNTEYGEQSSETMVSGTRFLVERYPQVTAHTPLVPGQWFEGGEAAWNEGRFVPNQRYRDMQALIGVATRGSSKRRAVR